MIQFWKRAQVILLAMIAMMPNQASSQAWDIKNFEVVGVQPTGDAHEAFTIVEVITRLLRNDVVDLDAPSFLQRLEGSKELDQLIGKIETVLSKTAHIMERDGLPPPALEPVVKLDDGRDAYRVYLVRGLSKGSAEYHPVPCDTLFPREPVIVLNYDQIQYNGNLTLQGISAVAHELFHAVQNRTAFVLDNCDNAPIGKWISEGTARAAGWIVASELEDEKLIASLEQPSSSWTRREVWGLRNYTRPLPVPLATNPNKEDFPPAYTTSSFWMYLAEYYATRGSPKSPGTNPYTLVHFAKLFEKPALARDCNSEGASCKAEIGWLDERLKRVFGAPLRDMYAKFIHAYALYGVYRIPEEVFWEDEWLRDSFGWIDPGCVPIEIGPDPDQIEITAQIPDFLTLSARCWEVRPVGFDNENIPIAIEAEVLSGSRSPSLNQLTSSLADGTQRWERADAKQSAEGNQIVTWDYDFPVLDKFGEEDGTLFFLTNVGDDAKSTASFSVGDGTDIRLRFTALQEYVSLGASKVDASSVADAIETALPIELDIFSATVFRGKHVKSEDRFVGTGYSEGVEKPCLVQIRAHAEPEQGAKVPNLLQVELQTSGPLRPGQYPVVFSDGFAPGKLKSESFPPGEVAAAVNLSDMPDKSNNLVFDAGTLKIDSVAAELIRGSIVGVGVHRKVSQATGKTVVTETRSISAEFSIRAEAPVGKLSNIPYACLAAK